jgi:hypothetical protein
MATILGVYQGGNISVSNALDRKRLYLISLRKTGGEGGFFKLGRRGLSSKGEETLFSHGEASRMMRGFCLEFEFWGCREMGLRCSCSLFRWETFVRGWAIVLGAGMLLGQGVGLRAQEYLNGVQWQAPVLVAPGETNDAPPSDAVVLFNGKDLSRWKNAENWKVVDGAMVVGRGAITSIDEFGDCQVHIEWSAPTPPKGSGQGRGNSGVFLMGIYELQVLDSFENPTYHDGQASSIYKQTPPMANAMRKPGQWNTYDILWTGPRFNDDGSLKSPAYMTVLHNGVVTLNHFELKGDTPYSRPPQYNKHPDKGPLTLQDHGDPVRFRNIWVRPLTPVVGKQERKPFLRNGDKETPIQ